MKRILCLLLVCALLVCGCANSEKDWQEQYDLGMRYLRDGDYEEAILAFSAAIEIDGNRPEAYLGRAEAYEAIGDMEKALKDYKKAQRVAKNNDDYEDLLEDLEEIIAELEQAIEEEPGEREEPIMESVKRLIKVEICRDDQLDSAHVLLYNDQEQLVQRVYEEYNYGRSTTYHYTYDEAGRLAAVNFGEYGSKEYGYDSEGRVVSYYSVEGGATSTTYEYDDRGRLLREVSWVDTGYQEVLYTYDERGICIGGSLAYMDYSGDTLHSGTISYAYDALGRMTMKTVAREDYTTSTEYTYYKNCVIERYTYNGNVWMNIRFTDTSGKDIWTLYTYDAVISQEEEDGYIVRIVGATGMEYLFLYETIDNETPVQEEPKKDFAPQKGVEYEIALYDDSLYDSNGKTLLEKYYELIVLQGNSPEIQNINRILEEDMQNFMSYQDYNVVSGETHYYTADATVTSSTGNIISIRISTFWFMGGVSNSNSYGLTFDISTGEEAYLPDVFGMSEEAMCQELKDRAWAYISANHANDLLDPSGENLYAYDLSDFLYYFEDGQLILTFPTYALTFGAAGSLTVPTGLYVQ